MEPMDFDSFVKMINEMANGETKVESPLSQLSSEELALIKAFDPDLVDEISAGKITPSEALLLARSATSNQEQEHVVKENDAECASSVLSEVFEAAEQRLENNRQEAKVLKEEADQDAEEDPDEGEISDEEWQKALDSKYEEIYNGKMSPNIADEVDLSNPKKIIDTEDAERVYQIMDDEVPCVFWDEPDYAEQGLLIAINGMGHFVKDDQTVWLNCAILDDVKETSFNPEDPLDDVYDHQSVDEADEIVIEEEMMFIPELKGKVGKIWQGEPTTDFNEAYDQALVESYMHEDCEIIVRDSLNRNVLDESIWSAIGKGLSKAGKWVGKLGKTVKGGADDAAKVVKPGLEKINKSIKFGADKTDDVAKAAGKAAKSGKAAKGSAAGKASNAAAKGGKYSKGDMLKAGAAGGAAAKGGETIWDTAKDFIHDKLDDVRSAYTNTIKSLADQGSNLSGTKGSVSGVGVYNDKML